MSKIKTLFGRKIKEYRKKLGMTQMQLAELVDVDDKHISCIESGKSFPSADLLERIAVALKVETKMLFEYSYLQEPADLKAEIVSMLDSLNEKEMRFVYKYIKNFLE